MRWTQTLIPTLKETPADAEVPSHRLMLRAGVIQKVASGSYSYLPLGLAALANVTHIVREEMDRAGAVEVFLPSLQPIEWWEQTGRRADYGDNLFVVKDRHGRELALGPTHEEVITTLFGQYVSSYRQLPLNLYQIQTKFRDEFRPRFGVLRSREFQMKDAYSFHITLEDLERTYQKMYEAYCRIFDRCGLKYVIVEAESGPIGGSASHEFMVPTPTGEDIIVSSDRNNYAANLEKAATGPRPYTLDGKPTGELEEIHTPDCPSIEDVCKFMKVKPKHMLKTMLYVTNGSAEPNPARPKYIIAVVRGDHQINEAKLLSLTRAATEGQLRLELADEQMARTDGFALGYVGPHAFEGRNDASLLIDFDAAQDRFWACGANQNEYHVKHFNWKRDVPSGGKHPRCLVADIRNAQDGDPSPENDGGQLRTSRGIEVGHVFKLGEKYTKALNVTVLDEKQQAQPVIMGCYGIGINRIIAAAIESEGGHDEHGIVWPMAIAPFHVLIVVLDLRQEKVVKTAESLHEQLQAADFRTLLDDRDARAGFKFKDADLVGIPIRLTVGEKALAAGGVEIKHRRDPKPTLVAQEQVLGAVKKIYEAEVG